MSWTFFFIRRSALLALLVLLLSFVRLYTHLFLRICCYRGHSGSFWFDDYYLGISLLDVAVWSRPPRQWNSEREWGDERERERGEEGGGERKLSPLSACFLVLITMQGSAPKGSRVACWPPHHNPNSSPDCTKVGVWIASIMWRKRKSN